jgi:hypothetical protein
MWTGVLWYVTARSDPWKSKSHVAAITNEDIRRSIGDQLPRIDATMKRHIANACCRLIVNKHRRAALDDRIGIATATGNRNAQVHHTRGWLSIDKYIVRTRDNWPQHHMKCVNDDWQQNAQRTELLNMNMI